LVFTRSEKADGHDVGKTRKQNFSRVARFYHNKTETLDSYDFK